MILRFYVLFYRIVSFCTHLFVIRLPFIFYASRVLHKLLATIGGSRYLVVKLVAAILPASIVHVSTNKKVLNTYLLTSLFRTPLFSAVEQCDAERHASAVTE